MANQTAEADLQEMTVAELKDMADSMGIQVPSHAAKDEIIKSIEKGQKANAKSGNSKSASTQSADQKDAPTQFNLGARTPQYVAPVVGFAPVVPAVVINPQPDRISDAYGIGSEFVVGMAQFQNEPANGQYFLFNLPPGSIVQDTRVKNTIAVAGAGACTAQIIDGNGNTYGAALDVTLPVSDTNMVTAQPTSANLGTFSQPTPVYLAMSSLTLANATAGEVRAWVRYTPIA